MDKYILCMSSGQFEFRIYCTIHVFVRKPIRQVVNLTSTAAHGHQSVAEKEPKHRHRRPPEGGRDDHPKYGTAYMER